MSQEKETEERLAAIKAAIPEDLYAALAKEAIEENKRKKGTDRKPSLSYRSMAEGKSRVRAPKAHARDRRYVPGALRHWRRVHGISMRDAQARIGYSTTSTAWSHWENEFAAPSYETLLRIIAATGLGYWVDEGAGVDTRLKDLEKHERERRKLRG